MQSTICVDTRCIHKVSGTIKFVTAVNKQMKSEQDNPTIGLLICKDKDDVVAEYALDDISQPIGIAAYELTKVLREEFKSSLPTVEEIENELSE